MSLNNKRNYIVYVHISPSNKYYVGITRQTTSKRWRNGLGYRENKHFYNAIKKYGWDNFQHEIISSNLTLEEASKFEIALIRELDSNNISRGYNNSKGGDGAIGYVVTKETKKKMSESKTGILNPMAKQVVCDGEVYGSAREFSRVVGIGVSKVQSWLAKVNRMPKEWYDKGLRYIDESMDAYKYKDTCKHTDVTDSSKNKKSNSRKHSIQQSKKVFCDGIIYNAIVDCAKFYNIKPATMRMWVNGTRDMPAMFYNMGLRLDNKQMCDYTVLVEKRGKNVVCDGNTYESIKKCASAINVNYSTLKSWLDENRNEEIPLEYRMRGLMLV